MKRPNTWDIDQLERLQRGGKAMFWVGSNAEVCALKQWLEENGRDIGPTEGGDPNIVISVREN